MPRLFVFGLGFTAGFLAQRLLDAGWSVGGTSRSAEACAGWRDKGVAATRFDGTGPLADFDACLAGADHVLHSIPPGTAGDPVLKWHASDLASRSDLTWFGYLSTTGVYGDSGGAWVTERDPVNPTQPRSQQRAEAEQAWLDLWRDDGLPVHLFRLAGIYGPDRNPLRNVLAGRARRIAKPDHVFSRIHVADIAAVLEASMARPDPGAIYNVCDDEPVPQAQVIEHACALLGREPPPLEDFATAEMSAMARSFYADNRRVSNHRIKQDLGLSLQFPTYREGLADLLNGLQD